MSQTFCYEFPFDCIVHNPLGMQENKNCEKIIIKDNFARHSWRSQAKDSQSMNNAVFMNIKK